MNHLLLLNGGFSAESFCANPDILKVLNFIGVIVTIFKWAIPILLIILGMVDVGKAVTSGEDKKRKEAYNSFLKRLLAAIVIFFIPAIVNLVMDALTPDASATNGCRTAILGE